MRFIATEEDIEAIRAGIKAGRFPNEAAVSQGIVLWLLGTLGWVPYDTGGVRPEYYDATTRTLAPRQ